MVSSNINRVDKHFRRVQIVVENETKFIAKMTTRCLLTRRGISGKALGIRREGLV